MSGGNGAPQMMFLPSQQTTTNQIPQWVQDAGKANYDAAANMHPSAFAPYQGPRVAGINQYQWDALGAAINNIGAANTGYDQVSNMTQNEINSAHNGLANASQAYSNIDTSALKNAIGNMNNAAGMGYNQVNAGNNGLSGALSNINSAYNPVTGGVSGLSGALGMIGTAYNPVNQATNPAMNSLQQSVNDARGMQGFQADRVSAQSLPQGDISAYMNPYTQNVIDSSLATLDQQRKNALNGNADSAINSKAGFGSRQAIQDAATNANYGLQGAQLAANLNNQNFSQAQQAMQADQARNLQAQLANQSAGIQGAGLQQNAAQLTGNLANTLGNLGINAGQFGVQAGNAYGNLGLQNAQTGISAGQAAGNLGLTARGQDISAQQANQNAALQSQANNINAYQNAGALGNSLANFGLNQAQGLANVANTQGQLGLTAAGQLGDLLTTKQNTFQNSINSGLNAANQVYNTEQNMLNANQQAYADYQNSLLAPLNLRMQALGMTPYNTSTNTSGFTSQTYQPTSSSLGSTLGGLGLMGLSAFGNAGLPGGGTVLGGLLGRGLGLK